MQDITLSPLDAQQARRMGHSVSTQGMVTAVQVVDRVAAEAMANELASVPGRLRTGFSGAPVYNGHPFHPDPTKRTNYPDKRAYGWAKGIEIHGDGFSITVDYNQLGAEAVNDAQFGYHSPQWRMELLPIARGEPIRCRPYKLTSGGLTNEPNIPGTALLAANDSPAPAQLPDA